jgi:hypothetical protein
MVYALLDDQSDACFVKETAVHALGTSGPDVKLKLSAVLAEEVVCCQGISGLIVRGVNEEIFQKRTHEQLYQLDVVRFLGAKMLKGGPI